MSKVALLKYYAKSTHHDAEQWPVQTVDMLLTHRVHNSGTGASGTCTGKGEWPCIAIQSCVFGKSATFEITIF